MADYWVDDAIRIKHPDKLFIGGKWTAASTSKRLTVIAPSTEQPVAAVVEAVEADVDRAVAAARDAFDGGPWPWLSVKERSALVRKFGALLASRAPELARCWTLQTGVSINVSSFATKGADWLYNYYADLVENRPLAEVSPRDVGGVGIRVREPVGVVAAISPWNYPLGLMSMKVAPALAMGCTIVAKPAPESPLDAFIMAECAEEAGLPPGVFNIATADRAASEHLVRHAGVDKVAFTGSTAAGKRIASICGERIARFSLELGGKSAAIVLDDADLDEAVKTLVPAAMMHAGQGCALLTRVLVSRRRRDALAERYAAALQALKIGDALDPATQLGPLAMKRQLERVEGFVAKGVSEGARIVTGGRRPAQCSRGFFLEPTLFVDVDNAMSIAREEIFGPVVSMIAYDTVDDAIRIANDSPFGLNGAVYTNDKDEAYRVARRVRAGNFTQNGLAHDPKFPFGGFKQSGIGRENGPEGLALYGEMKTIYMAEAPAVL